MTRNGTMMKKTSLRALAAALALALCLEPAGATWSIVAVDRRTREVAIGSATCLANFDLLGSVPAVAVGFGAAAVQASGDRGTDKQTIFEGLVAGDTPEEIWETLLSAGLSRESQQFGIVGVDGAPFTFTGSFTGAATLGVAGEVGDIAYAIQGNVLAGDPVVAAAEAAFVGTAGDLGQRLMASMEAARLLGGDGRCSCRPRNPTACGAPPARFSKSAHAGFVVISRVGDTDGVCGNRPGCANGEYYLSRNVIGDNQVRDPVFILQEEYDAWRASLRGRPDHLLSRVVGSARRLQADGHPGARVVVRLVDVDGKPVVQGGSVVTVEPVGPGAPAAEAGEVVHAGGPIYLFEVRGLAPGTQAFRITADDGVARATLYPFLEVEVFEPSPVFLGVDGVHPAGPARVPLVVTDPGRAREPFVIAARIPGGGRVPVPGTAGRLDASGRAELVLRLPAGVLLPLSGRSLELEAFALGDSPGRIGGAWLPVQGAGGGVPPLAAPAR